MFFSIYFPINTKKKSNDLRLIFTRYLTSFISIIYIIFFFYDSLKKYPTPSENRYIFRFTGNSKTRILLMLIFEFLAVYDYRRTVNKKQKPALL